MPLLRRPDLWLPPLALMGLIYFLSAQPSLDSGPRLGRRRGSQARAFRLLRPALRALVAAAAGRGRRAPAAPPCSPLPPASLYAVSDELHQIHGRGPARHAARLGDRQRRGGAGGPASRGETQAGRGLMLRRLPIESSQPILLFALSRVAIVVVGLTAMLVLSLPEDEARGGGGGLASRCRGRCWCSALTLRDPQLAMSPLVAIGDLAALVAIELVAPETYGGVRFAALFLIAAHAHFQGSRRGWVVGAVGAERSSAPRRCAATRRSRATCSPSTRPPSPPARSPAGSWSAGCAARSPPAGCAPATSRGARSSPRATCAGAWPMRSTTGPCRS